MQDTDWSRIVLPLLVWTALVGACDDGGGGSKSPAPQFGTIRFSMVGDATGDQDFVTITNDVDLTFLAVAETELPLAERTLLPIGRVDRGNGGHNLNWNWHFPRDEWTLTDSANSPCDGNAMIVAQAVDYWADTVGQFCPAGARVVSVRITQN